GGFIVIIDHLYDDIKFPLLNRPEQAGVPILDQDNLEGVRFVSVPSFVVICSCSTDRKPGTQGRQYASQ
ncbi:MAG TPA: hypothetical protein VK754_02205, partial [Propionibacteriaceae bacterium]|nr:hypothetical protein [Propionibacteriaceae bacterium]